MLKWFGLMERMNEKKYSESIFVSEVEDTRRLN